MIVFVKRSSTPFQVDGFDKKMKRSVKGSLHFFPGKPKEITDDEWKKIVELKLDSSFIIQKETPKKTAVKKQKEPKKTKKEPKKTKKESKKLV